MDRFVRYWIAVVSKDHVKMGVKQGILQACHGKQTPLKRMKKGDFVICYSGRLTLDKAGKCQEFTALGKVSDNEIYQFQDSDNFCPARRNIEFMEAEDISIIPFIEDLQFIKNKQSWGYPFRFGFFEINQHDFDLISSKMLRNQYE